MKRGLQFSIKYRPLSILAMAGGSRDMALGVGFIAGWGQITQTLIYQNYNALIPGYSGFVVGALLILCGLFVIIGAYRSKRTWMVKALNIQSLLWLFSTLVYVLNGYFLLAIIFGIFFTFPAGFIGFHIKSYMPVDERIALLLDRKLEDEVEYKKRGDDDAEGQAKQGDEEGQATQAQ